ncbi:hypothetical protein [Candidatus Symbiothrix dinenymphae]|uniref:hypothetical protein n=1 Tax=Candidatus Symbiothrix dinenymphae TaxID=467085 RepID=UPI0006E458D5|nr:hypothetical protein [Candidatus Symbiothrix dinenymphae]
MIKKQFNKFQKLSIKNMLKTYKSNKCIRAGLLWGAFMYLSITFLLPLLRGENITLAGVIIGIPLWLMGGLFWGYSMNNLNNLHKTDELKEDLENE